MKPKFLLAACIASMMFVNSASADDETPLGKNMDTMNDQYKDMRREEDPAKSAVLAKAAQDEMIKAIMEIPAIVKKMPDGPDKAKASAEYRMMMGSLISSFAELELAYLNKDMDKANVIIEKLKDMKKEGHKKFTEQDE